MTIYPENGAIFILCFCWPTQDRLSQYNVMFGCFVIGSLWFLFFNGNRKTDNLSIFYSVLQRQPIFHCILMIFVVLSGYWVSPLTGLMTVESDNMSKKGQKQRYPITKHPNSTLYLVTRGY